MKPETYNYWAPTQGGGIGPGPYTFRVTLADSSVITAENVQFVPSNDDQSDISSTGTQSVSGGFDGGQPLPPTPPTPIPNPPPTPTTTVTPPSPTNVPGDKCPTQYGFPETPIGAVASIPCDLQVSGSVTRTCQAGGVWGPPQYSCLAGK